MEVHWRGGGLAFQQLRQSRPSPECTQFTPNFNNTLNERLLGFEPRCVISRRHWALDSILVSSKNEKPILS